MRIRMYAFERPVLVVAATVAPRPSARHQEGASSARPVYSDAVREDLPPGA